MLCAGIRDQGRKTGEEDIWGSVFVFVSSEYQQNAVPIQS